MHKQGNEVCVSKGVLSVEEMIHVDRGGMVITIR